MSPQNLVVPERFYGPAFEQYVNELGKKPHGQEDTDDIKCNAHASFDAEDPPIK